MRRTGRELNGAILVDLMEQLIEELKEGKKDPYW